MDVVDLWGISTAALYRVIYSFLNLLQIILNHRVLWVKRDLKDHLLPTLLLWAGIPSTKKDCSKCPSTCPVSLAEGNYHQCTPGTAWIAHALLCFPSAGVGVTEVPHEDQDLWTRVCSCLSREGLIFFSLQSPGWRTCVRPPAIMLPISPLAL